MFRRGNRRSAPPRRGASNVRRLGRALTRATHGVRLVPSLDPPEFTSCPWWPLTVTFSVTADSYVVPKTVFQAIRSQLQWTALKVPFNIRLVSVRCWGLAKQPIQLAIYDHLGTKQMMAEMADYGDPVKYSRLGWKFGRVGLTDALAETDTDVLFAISGATDTQKVLVYLQLLWRVPNSAKPVALPTEQFEVLQI